MHTQTLAHEVTALAAGEPQRWLGFIHRPHVYLAWSRHRSRLSVLTGCNQGTALPVCTEGAVWEGFLEKASWRDSQEE